MDDPMDGIGKRNGKRGQMYLLRLANTVQIKKINLSPYLLLRPRLQIRGNLTA